MASCSSNDPAALYEQEKRLKRNCLKSDATHLLGVWGRPVEIFIDDNKVFLKGSYLGEETCQYIAKLGETFKPPGSNLQTMQYKKEGEKIVLYTIWSDGTKPSREELRENES